MDRTFGKQVCQFLNIAVLLKKGLFDNAYTNLTRLPLNV